MSIGWNYRREHLRLSQRSHSVITNGGDQPNVVPRNASIWFYFRENDQPHIQELWDIGNKMAEGAALMTNTKWTSRILGTAYPQHFNKPIAETMYANIQRVGLPEWSDADQALAKAPAEGARQRRRSRAWRPSWPSWASRCRSRTNMGGGSDDIGDISWNVPTVTLRYPANIPGLPGHNWSSAHRQRHADRPQGRRGRRQGAGDDHPRPAAPSPRSSSRRGTTSTTSRPRT